MKALSAHLEYRTSTFSQPQRSHKSLGIALPIKVLDADGSTLADALASLGRPAEFSLPDKLETVYVRLTWPSGKTETQRIGLLPNAMTTVTFSDEKIARNEWSTWAIPLLNSRTLHTIPDQSPNTSIAAYLKVWLRIWQFENGDWHPMPIAPLMQYKSEMARQIDLDLDAKPHLLQVGASNVPWRFVALPGGGPCRVLLTPNDSKDPRADPLKIVVTSFRSDAETLLEFMARDSVRAANIMANSTEMAVLLFEEKFHDPIAAVSGAYYLLRIDDWKRVPIWWWENLSHHFPWLPDTAIVHCVRLLRGGLKNKKTKAEAISLFKACIDRGWPVYEAGIQLLQEASSLLRQIAMPADMEYFLRVESLATAKTWAGAALSFYGKEPSKPSAVLWVGMPNTPRRRHLIRPEWALDDSKKRERLEGSFYQATAFKLNRHIGLLSPPKDSFARKHLYSAVYSAPSVPTPQGVHSNKKIAKNKKVHQGDWLLLEDIGN